MLKEEYKYSAVTTKIIACAIEVHKLLGNRYHERIYRKSLEEEFALQNVLFTKEFEIAVFYKGKQVGTQKVDFLVHDLVSVELKALGRLDEAHFSQAANYLEASNLEVGLLINFGTKKIECRRVLNTKYKLPE